MSVLSSRRGEAGHRSAYREDAFALGLRSSNCRCRGASLGTFVPPTIIELDKLSDLKREVFGPVLHVITLPARGPRPADRRHQRTGYGLTFGLHTRLDETIAHVTSRIKAGNLYVNRNIIGAVVGVQPFGGRGLSGTGPKAGGPLYIGRLVQTAAGAAASTVR
jgi:RHH-type proline utilization regulon transcriptional repressor/proline dehydrogenase/delta 1-pyrroline-5-carboxylate dehydrogenase